MTTAIDGAGTSEDVWLPWLADLALPSLDFDGWRSAAVVVVAAHPDDEILGAAGILQTLVAVGASIDVVWATDGEASHPGSRVMSTAELARRRRGESLTSLQLLGISPARTTYLGLPDGGLGDVGGALRSGLATHAGEADLIVAPWHGDGHPDHEAVGLAAAALDKPLLELPIWMWHWARPGDDRVPWQQCRAVPVPDLAAKRRAIDAFDSQVRPLGPGPGDAAILPPHVVARFVRPFEVVIT